MSDQATDDQYWEFKRIDDHIEYNLSLDLADGWELVQAAPVVIDGKVQWTALVRRRVAKKPQPEPDWRKPAIPPR